MKDLKFYLFSISAFLLFAVSCSNKKVEPALQNLMDEVMTIHDEVMPKMRNIDKLKKNLKNKAEGLQPNSPETVNIDRRVKALDQAEEGMVNWMKEYKKLSKLAEGTDAMAYYEAEKVKIIKVRDDMNGSIKNASDLLNQLKQLN